MASSGRCQTRAAGDHIHAAERGALVTAPTLLLAGENQPTRAGGGELTALTIAAPQVQVYLVDELVDARVRVTQAATPSERDANTDAPSASGGNAGRPRRYDPAAC